MWEAITGEEHSFVQSVIWKHKITEVKLKNFSPKQNSVFYLVHRISYKIRKKTCSSKQIVYFI